MLLVNFGNHGSVLISKNDCTVCICTERFVKISTISSFIRYGVLHKQSFQCIHGLKQYFMRTDGNLKVFYLQSVYQIN